MLPLIVLPLKTPARCPGKFAGMPRSALRSQSPYISGLQKGPAERGHVKKVKNREKVSKSFSTLFDNFRAGQKTSKIVEKCQKVFRHFSTIFARGTFFPGPFWGAPNTGVSRPPEPQNPLKAPRRSSRAFRPRVLVALKRCDL